VGRVADLTAAVDRPAGLKVSNLSKRFGASTALDGVTLELARGEVRALLGGNGSGKSTLIKILAGVHAGEPGGRIEVGGDAIEANHVTATWSRASGLTFVHQDLGLFDVMTVAENLFVGGAYPRRRGGIDRRGMRRAAQATLDGLEIPLRAERPLAGLRPVDRTLVAIARALHGRESFHAGVLVLDEPTARLPEPEVERLIAALRSYAEQGQTIVYVSHRLEEVFALAHSVTVLRDGRVVASRALDGLDEQQLVRMIVGRAVSDEAPRSARARSGAPVLELKRLSAGQVRDVSFELARGEVVGIAGLVGSGRTTLLEAIYGARPIEAGTIALDGAEIARHSIGSAIKRGLSYVPEDRATQAAFLSLGIPENLSASDPSGYFRRGMFRRRAEQRDAARIIDTFGIRTPSVSAPLAMLSGGNQQKTILARWLRRTPRVLLLDEPTQGVDVGARADIYAQIRGATLDGAAAIIVSSDFDELLLLADRILVLCGGRIAGSAPSASIDRHWLAERVYAIPEEVPA
jgi:ribose transport system ATP-binding protein